MRTFTSTFLLIYGLTLGWLSLESTALHLTGTWSPSDRYKFLTKFGFQRTEVDDLEATRGYIYGTIAYRGSNQSAFGGQHLGTLVLVDSQFILHLYGNGTEPVWLYNISGLDVHQMNWLIETERCRRMFATIDQITWHRTCAPNGRMDLLRTVPCPIEQPCAEEDNAKRIIGPSQFTYIVQDLRQPRYWYLSLVPCVRNPVTCEWETTSIPRPGTSEDVADHFLKYNIWLVNGAPHLQGYNRFQHQFSFEDHDTITMHLIFLALYLTLVVYVHLNLSRYRIAHAYLLVTHVWLCALGCLLTTIHLSVFSRDGRGLSHLSELGAVITQGGDAVFLVILISTAQMGFAPECFSFHHLTSAVSHRNHRPSGYKGRSKKKIMSDGQAIMIEVTSCSDTPWPFLISLSALFLTVKIVLYVWALIDNNPVIDFSVWNTVPGCILLALRFCVAFWFLAVLRGRQLEFGSRISDAEVSYLGPTVDLVHFAAGFLLWFFVLPMVVFITETSVSSLWRSRTRLSVCFSADYMAASAYAYLLFQTCANRH